MSICKKVTIILIFILISTNFPAVQEVSACKDIMACGESTEGDYNLLLKVRDPSRPDLQVLCIVPKGYEYTYRHPWTGKKLEMETENKYIGVASKGDTIPNIVKPGMAINSQGISFGDADSGSLWINPSKNAWDDFDWIRFACEKADTEKEALNLLTDQTVDKLHATGVSENLFVVGPNKGYIIEADAYRYEKEEVKDGVIVMTNYPKRLWRSQIIKRLPISLSFDAKKEKIVFNKMAIRLNSIFGIRIIDVGEKYVDVKTIPFIHSLKTRSLGETTRIYLNERKNVGEFSVELKEIENNRAKISLSYKYKAWEENLKDILNEKIGEITVKDMINWSRLHKDDLQGLRPMCEDRFPYEGSAIYKIPKNNFETMSMGWFSPNHACSSVFVPFHICINEIYTPYKTGEAARLSLNLLNEYGHDYLSPSFQKVEDVFLYENNLLEEYVLEHNLDEAIVSKVFTLNDVSMQKQAYLTEKMWMNLIDVENENDRNEIENIIEDLWNDNYLVSLNEMKKAINLIQNKENSHGFKNQIFDLAFEICENRYNLTNIFYEEKIVSSEKYDRINYLFNKIKKEEGSVKEKLDYCIKMFNINKDDEEHMQKSSSENSDFTIILAFFATFIAIAMLTFYYKKRTVSS
ncbi:MAG: hypothetical protein V5A68_00730 [Candidatus Thermoplasmatota archaeon]